MQIVTDHFILIINALSNDTQSHLLRYKLTVMTKKIKYLNKPSEIEANNSFY